jgi:quinol monooxygenase YgiN
MNIRRSSRLVHATLLAAIALAPDAHAQAQSSGGPTYAVTYVDVATTSIDRGLAILKRYRDQSRREPGDVEFTILQEKIRPNRFVIFEGWKDQAALDAHRRAQSSVEFDSAMQGIRNSPPFSMGGFHAYSTAPSAAAADGRSVYMVEHLDFRYAIAAYARPLVRALAEATQREKGAIRYDVYLSGDHHYTVVGVWRNMKAFEDHEAAAYTGQYRQATQLPLRLNLYDQRLYGPI